MAAAIVNFEARRDSSGHLKVYKLPAGDGGGTYEVAGINERYNKDTADALVSLIGQKGFDEAEALAVDFVADETDRAASWTSIPAIEFYLRDCVFNRGAGGAARILQRGLGVADDGAVGQETRNAERSAENNAAGLLARLRAAREQYERDVAHRDEKSKFWKGLVNRWNNALDVAKTFPMMVGAPSSSFSMAAPTTVLGLAGVSGSPPGDAPAPAILSALRVGMSGARVMAWQTFLKGQGFDPGVIEGTFGEHTRDATIAFQQKVKFAADGVAGRETLLKATSMGLELIEEPADDETSSNFPPRPNFSPLVSNTQREAVFGHYDFVPAPQPRNAEAIRILGTWEADNIISVPIPQLRAALGASAPKTMQFHRFAARQLKGLWADWEKAKLLDRLLVYDGSFVPRFVRGSRTTLSNHAFGSAFDINERFNKLGQRPALVGAKGSVRELVPIANNWGFWWGGHYDNRKDGMHFEVAFLK
ncbi:M15 family metallopeptidase [Mesorhizobium sp. M0482]|uniref:M15 family metallopeptidase n=1 Tax=Mesorhizobium sp. M0482 TaxID=2956948 RepID=UPI00333DCB30